MAHSLIGASLKRVEDATLLRGAGRYLDDLREPGTLHLAFVRSPYPHARIRGIDASAALALPGRRGDADAGGPGGGDRSRRRTARRARSCAGRRRSPPTWCGSSASRSRRRRRESAALAQDAVALVDVDYEPLPSAGRIEEAMQPGAAKVWDDLPDNVCFRVRQVEGDVDGLFAQAAHTVSVRIRRHRVCGVPLEPRGMLVRPEPGGGLTMWISTQMTQRIRDSLCRALGLERDTVRVIAPDVGGAFGVKAGVNREELVVAKAALKLGRPVTWVSTRMEDFLTTQQARDQLDEAEGAFDAEGHLLALRIKTWAAVGAYSPAGNTNLLARMILFSAGPYRHRAQDVEVTGLYLNANHSGRCGGPDGRRRRRSASGSWRRHRGSSGSTRSRSGAATSSSRTSSPGRTPAARPTTAATTRACSITRWRSRSTTPCSRSATPAARRASWSAWGWRRSWR